ncbi:MAG: hypothetical protein HY302_16540 [Opitutae bacterium]|nr:hypothetical protein [Opitutae bacterium]
MNKLLPLLLLGIVLTGCESVTERVRERFAPVPPKTQVFAAGKKTVFSAALLAAKQTGFTLQRGSESDGTISAYSRVRPGDSVRAALQFTIEVQLTAVTDTTTEVAVRLAELREGELSTGGGEVPLREHGLYSSYFEALERNLAGQDAVKSVPAKP